jgi:Zn-finger nucleic acid-binding protein
LKEARPARPALTVHPSLLRERFAAGCDTRLCAGACCRTGVWLDPGERDRILAHADLVRAQMEPGQARDPRRWFSRRARADRDFPSGRAVYTRVFRGRCVFLDGGGRCVLQKATLAGGGRPRLKPFFCTAFPVTIVDGVVMLDDTRVRAGQPCCAASAGGPLSALDTCGMELAHVLGAAGVARLRRRAARLRSPGTPPRP